MFVSVCVIASQWGLPLKRSFVDLSSRLLTSHSHIAPSSRFYLIFIFAFFVDLSSQLSSHTYIDLNALLTFTELYLEPPTISFGILQCQLLQNCNNCKFPPIQQLQSWVPLNSNEAKKLMSDSGWNLNSLICDICYSIRASSKRSSRNKIEVIQLLKLNLIHAWSFTFHNSLRYWW